MDSIPHLGRLLRSSCLGQPVLSDRKLEKERGGWNGKRRSKGKNV